jgi:DUF3037 family protein
MTGRERIAYNFAVLRLVPHVHLGEFVPVGVILHARTIELLALRAITDRAALAARLPGMDHDLIAQYLSSFERICTGDAGGGPIALAPPSERFHWLTAPRSDILQTSPIHEGLTDDPRKELDTLFLAYVGH